MKLNELKKLVPLQNSVRDYRYISKTVEKIKTSGNHVNGINDINKYINITYFTDEDFYLLHDGHHRVSAYILAEKDIDDEFVKITEFTTTDYMEINFQNYWTTPLHPIQTARRCDLSIWWKLIKDLKEKYTESEVENFIKNNSDLYSIPRIRITNMDIFASQYKDLTKLFI